MRARETATRHPIAAFMVICLAINWLVILPPLRRAMDVMPLGLEGGESAGTLLGVAGAAFLVTTVVDGRVGVRDLASRSVRWRVGFRWYLLALGGMPIAVLAAATASYGWEPLRALADGRSDLLTHALPLFLLLILLFNVPEEIGFTGFVQARLQDRHSPLRASVLTALPFALFHMPVNLVEEGWVFALAFLPIQTAMFVFVRALIIWFYNGSGSSVLIAGLFHSSFNATVNTYDDYIPGPEGTSVLLGTLVAILAAVLVLLVTRGRLGKPR
ncbi:MAG: CPBP family intramembrane glutamic endopeptidase [Nocardioidaceae bacterium]